MNSNWCCNIYKGIYCDVLLILIREATATAPALFIFLLIWIDFHLMNFIVTSVVSSPSSLVQASWTDGLWKWDLSDGLTGSP